MDKPLSDFEGHLDMGDRLYAEENYEEALRVYERSIKAGQDDSQRAEGYCAVGDALLALGRPGEALYMYAKAVDLDPDFAGGYCGQADVHFERWEFDKAIRLARQALQRDPDYARAHYLLALVHEKAGDEEEAQERFRRASNLDAEYYPLPFSLPPEAFADLVQEALKGLPEEALEFLRGVQVEVKGIPDEQEAASYRDQQIGPQVPGLLLEPDEPADEAREAPPLRLVLYRRNLEKMATSAEALLEEVQKTVLHEIADLEASEEEEGPDAASEEPEGTEPGGVSRHLVE